MRLREMDFYSLIVDCLFALGSSARRREVLNAVRDCIQPSESDLELLPVSAQARWENEASWARKRLVQFGYLRSDSPRGWWELSEEGWALADIRAG